MLFVVLLRIEVGRQRDGRARQAAVVLRRNLFAAAARTLLVEVRKDAAGSAADAAPKAAPKEPLGQRPVLLGRVAAVLLGRHRAAEVVGGLGGHDRREVGEPAAARSAAAGTLRQSVFWHGLKRQQNCSLSYENGNRIYKNFQA